MVVECSSQAWVWLAHHQAMDGRMQLVWGNVEGGLDVGGEVLATDFGLAQLQQYFAEVLGAEVAIDDGGGNVGAPDDFAPDEEGTEVLTDDEAEWRVALPRVVRPAVAEAEGRKGALPRALGNLSSRRAYLGVDLDDL